LRPFIDLTLTVSGNKRHRRTREGFTHAGGLKRTGKAYIDTYTGVKRNAVNAVLVAYVEKKGGEPVFALYDGSGVAKSALVGGDTVDTVLRRAARTFSAETLHAEALPTWQGIVAKARAEA
jgi:hypothetical protein